MIKKSLLVVSILFYALSGYAQELGQIYYQFNHCFRSNEKSVFYSSINFCEEEINYSVHFKIVDTQVNLSLLKESNNFLIIENYEQDSTFNFGLLNINKDRRLYFSFGLPHDMQPTNLANRPKVHSTFLHSISLLDCELKSMSTLFVKSGFIQYLSLNDSFNKRQIIYIPSHLIAITEFTLVDELIRYFESKRYELFSIVIPHANENYYDYLWLSENKYLNDLLHPKED
jgi:hypothetical protein